MKYLLLLFLAGCGSIPGEWHPEPTDCPMDIEFPEPGVCGAELRVGECVYTFEPDDELLCWAVELGDGFTTVRFVGCLGPGSASATTTRLSQPSLSGPRPTCVMG